MTHKQDSASKQDQNKKQRSAKEKSKILKMLRLLLAATDQIIQIPKK